MLTMNVDFLVEPQNQGRRFVSSLALKPLGQFVSGLVSKPVATVFSDLASKPVVTIFSGLALKLVTTVSPSLASKPVARVSLFGPQNWQLRFGDLDLKITTKVSWFRHQNQAGFGLSVAS
jgi:hypothetical protein